MAEDPARWGPRADKDGEVIAHILATIQNYPPAFETKRYGLVNDLAVASAYRRIGIGQHLFAMVKDWFVTRGIKRIEIEVAVANEVSTSFWAKMDFRPYKEVYYLELQYAPPNKPMNQMS
jgi:GNAT superfamily N-acetyltransferase